MREPSREPRRSRNPEPEEDVSLSDRFGELDILEPGTLSRAPRRIKRPARFDLLRSFARNLAHASLLATIPSTAALAVTGALWVGTSAVPVVAAAAAMNGAQDVYFRTLEQGQPVLTALSQVGAPVDQVEIVYFSFIDSPLDEKAHAADVLLGVLNGQADAVRAEHGAEADAIRPLLGPANMARGEATEAYVVWDAAASTPGGTLAVMFGLAPGPSDAFSQYSGSVRR